MAKSILRRVLSALLVLCLVGSAAAANLLFDVNNDGKTDITDLQQVSDADKEAALDEALGGGDELHKNAEGQWEIWSSLGLYNMAKQAQSGDTFVLMQDIDMADKPWTPVENFNGKLLGQLHTISNLEITQDVSGNMGFFANIAEGGVVEYLNIKDMSLVASENAVNIGAIAGSCAGTIDGSTATSFVTDTRTSLPSEVYVGGMAGKMLPKGAIIGRDNNKLPKVGEEQPINTISAYIGVRFAKQDGHLVGIAGYSTDAVDSGALLQDLTGTMPDPYAIAWVVTGSQYTFPHTVDEMRAAVDPSGNTVITLQQDITHTAAIRLEYACTFDCNGYTVATPPDKNNGIQVMQPGTENPVFTLKNGTLTHNTMGIYAGECAVVISNMVIVAEAGAPLGLYTNKNYSDINKIENCTLVSKNWTVVQYNKEDVDMSANGITIENSKLIACKASGSSVFGAKTTLPGVITLGNNVDIYTYSDKYTSSAIEVSGVDPVKLADTASVTVLGITYSGLNHWTTDETIISTEVIAEVTNGSETKQVTNVNDLLANIKSDGNTQVKLLRDIERTSQIKIPYSCHIDLNGFSITVTSGNAIMLAGVGKQNTVTTIENGTLNHSTLGVRVNTGSLHLSNVTINGIGKCGASVGYYDPSGAYKDGNVIENCVLNNPYSECIKYFPADDTMDFKDTGVKISDTTLIAQANFPFGVSTNKLSGIVDLGEGVEIYSIKTAMNTGSLYRFLGLVAYTTDKTSVTVNGTEITGMNHWSTDEQRDIVNILMIGNSYSTTIPQELYNIATNAGYEVNVANLYYPGCIASEHWDWLNNDVANYQYRHQSPMGNYIRRGDMSTMRYALDDMDWDVIIYQDWFTPKEVVRESGYACDSSTLEKLYECHQEDAYNVMQYLKTNYPNAEHYYYQHWAWQVGHSAIPNIAAANAMWERIDTASNKFANDNDFILIPCGAAFQLARSDERIGEGVGEEYSLWDTDKSHDGGPGGGQFLNGCVFFETIFRVSCTADTTWGESSTKLTDEQVAILREHAHQAVVDTHGEDWVSAK